MPLDEYRRRRDAARTPEPVPATDPDPTDPGAAGPGTRFVVQEHHASSLHWDVRFERDGVLASWAVPKGLPVDTETVRLAVRTEDHPLEYLTFHGEIPAGEYGAGRMTIWDSGTYETEKWHSREVAVVLHGERARGRFVFLRTGRGDGDWLLRRRGPGAGEPLPREARLVEPVPGDRPAGWWLQPLFGGRRVLVRVEGGRAVCTDTDGAEVRGPRGLGPALSARPVLLDAELVGPDLWLGDLLHLDGRDVRDLPWRERHALLEGLGLQGPHWRPAPVFPGGGDEVVAGAAAQGLPGVVAKDPDAPYAAGWVVVATGRPAPAPPPPGRDPRVGRARLTNPGKVLYPLTGTTKADVLAHYRTVAPALLPHLRDRPVTLVRWPDGVERGSFFEKDVSRHAPDWIRTARLQTPGGRSATADFPVLTDEEGLAWAANLAALELHVPQWRLGPGDEELPPDLVVFDLDPGEGADVVDCARVALRLAHRMLDDGLTAYPRTSGGKGMQLYVPVTVDAAETTSAYARALAEELQRDDPRRVTAVMAKARRRGRVFVDWSQNDPRKTTIGSYSLRGRARPTVATPLTWEEVGAARRREDLVFVLGDLPGRLAEHGDLLAPLLEPGPPLYAR